MSNSPCVNQNIVLNNGTVIRNLGDIGTRWNIDAQLEHINRYFDYGINIQKGNIVIDIGANIGIFSLMACDMCCGEISVYAFEPVFATYCDLEKNIEGSSSCIQAYNFGISDKEKEIAITHYPNAPGLSTLYPDGMDNATTKMINNLDENVNDLPEFFKGYREREENRERSNKIRTIWGLKTLFESKKIPCRVVPLSKFIKKKQLDIVHLLKVDTNGSELDVLNGINEEDYRKINQIVIETPLDSENYLTIKKKLSANGFVIMQEAPQEPVINSGLIYTIIYAVNEKQVYKSIKQILVHDIFSKYIKDIDISATENIDHYLDSMQILRVISEIEKKFNILLDERMATESIGSLDDICNILAQHKRSETL